MKKKIPWLAAILNLIVPGVGYLYAGKKRLILAWGLTIASVSAIISSFVSWELWDKFYQEADIFVWVWMFAFAVALAVDAYKDAKENNA